MYEDAFEKQALLVPFLLIVGLKYYLVEREISLFLLKIYLLDHCQSYLFIVIRMYLLVHYPMQCSFNVIAYKDKPRLRTALEMLKTTQEIERRLEEVCVSPLLFSPVVYF